MALVVITGGARSGKSGAAQRLAQARDRAGQNVVVAVFASESDPEMTDRIAAHKADRPDAFGVVEASESSGWLDGVADDSVLVVDCLGTCFGLAMLEAWAATAGTDVPMTDAVELPPALEGEFGQRAGALVDSIVRRTGDTIVVTNEVGSGIVPTYATGRLFRDELGRANATLVGSADAAYVAVGGRLLDLATLPRDAAWPED